MTVRQTHLVHARLKRGPLTPLEALQELGCARLAARVHELREQGVKIQRSFVQVRNKWGERVRVAKYSYGGR